MAGPSPPTSAWRRAAPWPSCWTTRAARQARRWKNLVRRTDYIGSWIFADPAPGDPDPGQIQPGVDQPCWDPVTLSADLDPTPPPIHYHSGFWPDPRVTQLGRHLGETSFWLTELSRDAWD